MQEAVVQDVNSFNKTVVSVTVLQTKTKCHANIVSVQIIFFSGSIAWWYYDIVNTSSQLCAPLPLLHETSSKNNSSGVDLTRTSEWCILVLEIQVNWFLCRDISWVWRINEISLHKNYEPDLQTRIHHELVLVVMPYYFCFDDIVI